MMLNLLRYLNTFWLRSGFRQALIFIVAFGLYRLTMAPSVYNLDSAELTTAAATLGIPRSTGYPLYILIGHLWTLLPFGDVGFRMNLFSVFCGCLTLAILDKILLRLGLGSYASLTATGIMAISPFFWGLSLVAEVYTLQTVITALLIYLMIRWEYKPTGEGLWGIMLVLGLGLDHHLATLLLIPGVALFVISRWKHALLTPKDFFIGLVCLLGPLLLYLYLPLRYLTNPPFNYAGTFDASGRFHPFDLTRIDYLWGLVTGGSFRKLMFQYFQPGWLSQIAQMLGYLWNAFAGFGIGPGVIGLIRLFKTNWHFAIASLSMFGINFVFYLGYGVIDKQTMLLPLFLIFSIWVGCGIRFLVDWVRNQDVDKTHSVSHHHLRWPTLTLQTVLGLCVVLTMISNYPRIDLSEDRTRDFGIQILNEVKPHAIVIGFWDTIPVVQYLQMVEGQRRDVLAINRFLIDDISLQQLIKASVNQRPVYIDSLPIELSLSFQEMGNPPMYTIQPKTILLWRGK